MRLFLYSCLVLVLVCCKEKYEPPVNSSGTGYLVIENVLSPTGPSEVRLSRTIALPDSARMVAERAAVVQVEGKDGSKITLPETGTGLYTHASMNLNPNQQYRLYIKTRDGKDYASDYVPVRNAPPIDSINWVWTPEGVDLYINTHDPNNNTWYYRWETEETWEFHSYYQTSITFDVNPRNGEIVGVKYRKLDGSPELSLFYCWQNENSTSLKLGSSAKLSEDIIHLPIIHIPNRSWKLSVLYSVLVKQYALSEAEYEFLQKMKRNSEETGSIFDRQPSELKGNIRSLTNASEPVIGFIGIANRHQQRLWIRNSEVPGWGYSQGCQNIIEIPSDSAWAYPHLAPVSPADFSPSGKITKYTAGEFPCVDCTTRGVNTKPSFWP